MKNNGLNNLKTNKMKNIHILPTQNPTWLHKSILTGVLRKSSSCIDDMKQAQGMNIYITNLEEIKEDEYYLGEDNNIYCLVTTVNHNGKKIILTTDQDLIKDGVQAVDDEFLEWFVNNPSCESVEVESKVTKDGVWTDLKGYVELPTTHSIIHKIIIPKEEPCTCTDECLGYLTKTCKRIKEEPKQEKLEEAIELAWSSYEHEEGNLYSTTFKNGFKLGSIWEKDQNNNKYTEEDFLKFSEWVSHNDWVYLPSKACWVNEEQEELEQKLTTKELFEKFKKKIR